MVSVTEVAELANAVAWPVLVGVLLVVYRRNIEEMGRKLGPRIQGLTLGPVSFQFATATGVEPLLGSDTVDLRSSSAQTASQVLTSTSGPKLVSLLPGSRLDYVIFDLGQGDKWLTSRLYLFAVILHRIRYLRSIIFVEKTTEGIRHHFVGSADPTELAWALAHSYPWMEAALSVAIGSSLGIYNNTALDDAQNEWLIENVIQNYIKSLEVYPTFLAMAAQQGVSTLTVTPVGGLAVGQLIQIGQPPTSELASLGSVDAGKGVVTIQAPLSLSHPAGEIVSFMEGEWSDQWVAIGKDGGLWEHAKWVGPERLNRILQRNGTELNTSAIRKNELFSKDKEAQERLILHQEAEFVALLNDDGSVATILDRMKVLDRLALKS